MTCIDPSKQPPTLLMDLQRKEPLSNMNYSRYLKVISNRGYESVVKEQLNELNKQKKIKEPILTADEKASKVNKATIKGTGIFKCLS